MQIYSEIYFIFRTDQKLHIHKHTWQPPVTWQRHDSLGDKQGANSEAVCQISSLDSRNVCPCPLYSTALQYYFLFPKLSWGIQSLPGTFLLSILALTFTRLQAISPVNVVCHVGWAVKTLCKLREQTCPHYCHLSALDYDHVAGMAAAQVCTGLLAAVSVSRSHQFTCPSLSLLTWLCQPQPGRQLHNFV